MTVTPQQSASAAHPDRPRDVGSGLQIDMGQGSDGQYLEHVLSTAASVLHLRWCLNPLSAAGGRVVLFAAFDQAGDEIMRVMYDASPRQVTVTLATNDSLTATLDAAFDWHCLEIGIDTGLGTADLWYNGLPSQSVTGAFQSLTAQTVWVGGLRKDSSTAGTLAIDEIVIDQQYIGPVIALPASEYADDPARWLVIYNRSDPDGIVWADYYRSARSIPYANLLGLDLQLTETITASEYEQMRLAINDYLDNNGLRDQVIGILLGYRVPGYVDKDGLGTLESVASLMHLDTSSLGGAANPLALNSLPERPTPTSLAGNRLTARIDAPTLSDAIALVDRSTQLINNPLGNADDATVWFDPFANPTGLLAPYVDRMIEWGQSVDRMHLRLPFEWSGDPQDPQEASFDSIKNDGFFWAWNTASPPARFFDSPPGRRVLCAQLDITSGTATTLRDPSPGNWIDTAIASGYAAASGACRPYFPDALPYARPFFESLRRGWALAEAWYLALPVLREGLYLVGDPLLTVSMPQNGWDILGPVAKLEALIAGDVIAHLRESEHSYTIPQEHRPAEGSTLSYVVRHVDAKGRAELSLTQLSMTDVQGLAAQGVLLPVWPDHEGWPMLIRNDMVVLQLLWDRAIDRTRLSSIELVRKDELGVESTTQVAIVDRLGRSLTHETSVPTESSRFRWKLISKNGAVSYTPWSRYVRTPPVVETPLTLLEVMP